MKILAVVAGFSEVATMKKLLRQAGFPDADVAHVYYTRGNNYKPAMKDLREIKVGSFDKTAMNKPYDYIFAAGETAARMVLDTSAVNINKLRGRDFEYQEGAKKPGKKSKDSEGA